MTGWEYQFNQFLQLLASPAGLLLLIGCGVLAGLAISKPWARLVVLALMIWSTTLTGSAVATPGFDNTLIFPLEQLRDNTRVITLVCLGILLLPTLSVAKGWRRRLIAAPMVAFFVFQVMFSTMDTLLSDAGRGVLGLGIVVMTLFVLGRGISAGVQDRRTADAVIKAVGAAAALFVLASSVQGIINPDAIKRSGRFYATTANPQFAATTIGVMMPVVAYLIIQKGIGRFWRLAMCCTMGLLVVFLLWTGSRTGMLMSTIGLVMLFRLRLGKLAVAAAAAAVALLVGLQLFGGELAGADRLISLEDTRSGAWLSMWDAFQSNPLLGSASYSSFGSENSFLWTAARYGVLGFVPLIIATFAYLWFALKLQLLRGSLDKPHRLLADLVVSVVLTVGAGALFEGYLLGQFNIAVFTLLTVTVAGQYLFDAQRQGVLADDAELGEGVYGEGAYADAGSAALPAEEPYAPPRGFEPGGRRYGRRYGPDHGRPVM